MNVSNRSSKRANFAKQTTKSDRHRAHDFPLGIAWQRPLDPQFRDVVVIGLRFVAQFLEQQVTRFRGEEVLWLRKVVIDGDDIGSLKPKRLKLSFNLEFAFGVDERERDFLS